MFSMKKMYRKLFLVSACLTVLLVAMSYAQMPKDLVVYLSFDDGGGKVIKDLSGSGNDGENHGAKSVEGRFGKALEYGGGYKRGTGPGTPRKKFWPKDSPTAESPGEGF